MDRLAKTRASGRAARTDHEALKAARLHQTAAPATARPSGATKAGTTDPRRVIAPGSPTGSTVPEAPSRPGLLGGDKTGTPAPRALLVTTDHPGTMRETGSPGQGHSVPPATGPAHEARAVQDAPGRRKRHPAPEGKSDDPGHRRVSRVAGPNTSLARHLGVTASLAAAPPRGTDALKAGVARTRRTGRRERVAGRPGETGPPKAGVAVRPLAGHRAEATGRPDETDPPMAIVAARLRALPRAAAPPGATGRPRVTVAGRLRANPKARATDHPGAPTASPPRAERAAHLVMAETVVRRRGVAETRPASVRTTPVARPPSVPLGRAGTTGSRSQRRRRICGR
jgi:hypothetical protein